MKKIISAILWAGIAWAVFSGRLAADPAYPSWWVDRGVVPSQPPAGPSSPGYNPSIYNEWMADNYSIALIGQAKNMAKAAKDTMELAEANSSGPAITALVGGFSTALEDNYVPLNLGQIKALAKPFYDRMHAVEFTVVLGDGTVIGMGQYPWNPATPVSENYAAANLGQLKHVFSFSLAGWPPSSVEPDPNDTDSDDLLDSWEMTHFGSLVVAASSDSDADGLSNLTEFRAGSDPLERNNASVRLVLFAPFVR